MNTPEPILMSFLVTHGATLRAGFLQPLMHLDMGTIAFGFNVLAPQNYFICDGQKTTFPDFVKLGVVGVEEAFLHVDGGKRYLNDANLFAEGAPSDLRGLAGSVSRNLFTRSVDRLAGKGVPAFVDTEEGTLLLAEEEFQSCRENNFAYILPTRWTDVMSLNLCLFGLKVFASGDCLRILSRENEKLLPATTFVVSSEKYQEEVLSTKGGVALVSANTVKLSAKR